MSLNRRGTWGPKGKGPSGRNLCYCGCGREVPTGKRTTFGPTCYQSWAAKYNPATQRRLVYERDHGICAICGEDTERRKAESRAWFPVFVWLARRYASEHSMDGWEGYSFSEIEAAKLCAERFGVSPRSGHAWEADHIIPVIEGGGECDLSNLRTLCMKCHKKETAALAKRRAEKRRMMG